MGSDDRHRRVISGDTVLVHGSRGVSIFALQFARLLGGRMIATTSTAKKATLGASKVVNYTEAQVRDVKVRELTMAFGV